MPFGSVLSSFEMDKEGEIGEVPFLEEAVIEVEEYSNEGVEFAKRTLVGKILFERILNRAAAKMIIAKAWGEPEGLKIADMGPNIFYSLSRI